MALIINDRKVDENDPESIKKAIKSLWFGYIFVLVGLIAMYFLTAERFVCYRSQNTCEFQARHIWNLSYYTKRTMPLSDITEAHVETHHGSDSTTYQVMLTMNEGKRSLFNGYSSDYDTHADRADKINSYLSSQKEELEISESLWLLFIPFPFILAGLYLAVYEVRRLKKRLKELEQKDKMHFHSDLK